jgi:SagB-type dehydrogenase family enzyme
VGGLLLTETAVRLGWRPGLSAARAGDAPVVVVSDGARAARVSSATPARAALLELLGASDGAPPETLVDAAASAAAEGERALSEIEARSLLNLLAGRGLLAARLVDAEGLAATIATPVPPDAPVASADALVLSGDVLIRRADDLDGGTVAGGRPGLVLESAADPARRDPITPRFVAALLTGELPLAWRAVLLHAGVLVPRDDDPGELPPAGRWEFHDRLFHTRSRLWRGPARPYGVTMRLDGLIDPLPACAIPANAGEPLPLPVPERDRSGEPLAEVAERRRSSRQPAGPLHVRQLGELLHSSVRIRAVRPASAGDEVDRPVPSGGALGAVGVYPLVVSCEGVEPGLYHYDGREHALRGIEAAGDADLEPLVAGARATAGLPPDAPIQVLLVLTARFGRLQYKYSGMAYAAALKDVGVLYQALYLTATAIGIGGCALGGGDALAFERASGLDRWEEGSIGEFLIVGGDHERAAS